MRMVRREISFFTLHLSVLLECFKNHGIVSYNKIFKVKRQEAI